MSSAIPWWARRLSPTTRNRIRPHAAAVIRRLPGRRPRWGNLRRAKPFSAHYGFDRGTPVDRLYIERFLTRRAGSIGGDVLEVRSADYTRRFGRPGLRSHVVDIDASNPAATIVGDLCEAETLGDRAFDCAILTQTLQFLPDPGGALANLWRSLRPGGTLLVTVPCAARIDHESPESDFSRWTPAGLRHLVDRSCGGAEIEIEAGGNLTAALAVLLGLAIEDMRRDDLATDDPVFPVIACAAATKPIER